MAGGQSKPKVPEAILTCVQCKSEYKESENGEGSCKYHTSKLTGFHRYTYSCCNANSPNYESALSLTGCTKGRHRSEHHDEYTYSAYFSYMSEVVSSFCIHCGLRACWSGTYVAVESKCTVLLFMRIYIASDSVCMYICNLLSGFLSLVSVLYRSLLA